MIITLPRQAEAGPNGNAQAEPGVSVPVPHVPAGAPERFPIAAFPSILHDIAANLAKTYQVPLSLPGMTALGVLAGAIGKGIHVVGAYRDKSTPLNLYLIAGANRGSGKDNICSALVAPLARRSRKLAEKQEIKAGELRAEIGLLKKEIENLKHDAAKDKSLDRENQLQTIQKKQLEMEMKEREASRSVSLVVDNFTSEGLHKRLADNDETLCAVSPEGGDAVKVSFGKYSSGKGDYDLILKAYGGTPHDSARAGKDNQRLPLVSPCLSLIWMVQLCVLQDIMADNEATERGFTCRPLIFDTGAKMEADSRELCTFTLREKWEQLVDDILDGRLSCSGQPRSIGCTPEARDIFADFHDRGVKAENGPFADLQGELSRTRENAIRVAGIFAVVECSDVISADIAARAVQVLTWCTTNYLTLRMKGRRERLRDDLDRVLDLLREYDGDVNVGVLARKHGIPRPLLDCLVVAFPNHLMIQRRETGGRPAEVLTRPPKPMSPVETVPCSPLNPLNPLKPAEEVPW